MKNRIYTEYRRINGPEHEYLFKTHARRGAGSGFPAAATECKK